MKEKMRIEIFADGACTIEEFENHVNDFLDKVDPVSIQMGHSPEGDMKVMVVHRVRDESKDADKSPE